MLYTASYFSESEQNWGTRKGPSCPLAKNSTCFINNLKSIHQGTDNLELDNYSVSGSLVSSLFQEDIPAAPVSHYVPHQGRSMAADETGVMLSPLQMANSHKQTISFPDQSGSTPGYGIVKTGRMTICALPSPTSPRRLCARLLTQFEHRELSIA